MQPESMALQEASKREDGTLAIPPNASFPQLKPNSTQNSLAPLLTSKVETSPEELSNIIYMPPSSDPENHEEINDPQQKCSCGAIGKFLRSKLLVVLSVLGIVLGFVIGFAVRPFNPSEDLLMWIGFPGDIFLSLLKMTILPLIISSVITATSSMDPQQNGRIGALQVTYLALTNLLGAVMGIILAVVIKPGAHMMEKTNNATSEAGLKTTDIFADLIRNIFPDNIARAMMQKKQTTYERIEMEVSPELNITEDVIYELRSSVIYTNSTNVIGLIFVCVIFGIAAGQAKEKGRAFLAFFQSASEIVLIVIGWFLWVSPIGICSLIATSIASISHPAHTFARLGLFVAAVSTGIAAHQLVIMPLIHLATTRTNPFTVLGRSVKAWFVAFASTSSAPSMPYMYEIADSYSVDRRVSGFCIPIGVTLNADGSALFICTSVLFLAQMHGIVMDMAQMAVLGTLTTISTLALPSVPSSSLVVIVIICTALAIPASSIGLLFTVEWLLDRLRTTSNVVTDIYAFLFVWHMTKNDIKESDEKAYPDEYDDMVPELPMKASMQSHNPSIHGSSQWILGNSFAGSKFSLQSFHGM